MKESQLLELDIDLALFEYNDNNCLEEDLLPAGIQKVSKQELQEPFTLFMQSPDYDYLTYSMFGYESFEIYEKPLTKGQKRFHKSLRSYTDLVGASDRLLGQLNIESGMLPPPNTKESYGSSQEVL